MAQQQGSISIHAQNIMPIIKRWLYSDKDIFIREMVSNGCDAITKRRMIAPAETDDYRVTVTLDAQKGELTFSDNGIGMTADEVERYINQVAFSGAEEFLKNYEGEDKGGIIGHFGLGFYSAFMVADRVTIETLSGSQGATPVRWVSEDGMAFTMEDGSRTQRGTDIILHISPEEKDFLEEYRVREVLRRYCGFMSTPVYFDVVKPQPEQKPEGEDKPQQPQGPERINATPALWLKAPKDCTEDEYKQFYREVFHTFEDPLFYVHLNVDYPFNLKGILYFPKITNDFGTREGEIKLFSGQVFVADNIKEVIPEFLMLLKGVIDCPDLPLNVSRSFLQNDGYVKKMAAYITRKVADRLLSEFNNRREDYQKYWDDIHPFVKYGCIRDEKFYERVKPALLYKTSAGDYLTLEEYKNKDCPGEETTVYYASDEKRQAQMIRLYTEQGKDVVLLDTLIDNNFISFLEYTEREQKLKFLRVDAAADGLTDDGEAMAEDDLKRLCEMFKKATGDDTLSVEARPFKSDDLIAMITVDEQSRRLTEMSRQWGRDMNLPEKRTLVLNRRHPVVKYLEKQEDGEKAQQLCAQVFDLAEMARQPLVADRMVEFLKRSNALLTMLIEK